MTTLLDQDQHATSATSSGSTPDEFTVNFTRAGNLGDFEHVGWSTPEEHETWAIADHSTIALPLRKNKDYDYVLTFTARPHIVEGVLDRQRVVILVNQTIVAEFSLRKPTTRSCYLPARYLSDGLTTEIIFRYLDAAAPASFGASTDARKLSLAFSSLTIHAAPYSERSAIHSDTAPVQIDIRSLEIADRLPPRDLILKFESLGQNCEFGLVQRSLGAEPLGLLRFSSTPLPKLLQSLNNRFDGMGAPGSIRVEVSTNGREYMVNDLTYGFLYHAFAETGSISPDEIVAREMRRVPFLVRKLIGDLELAEKIFLYRGMGALDEEEIFPLATAIRRYGPNTLLFVTLSDAEHKSGTVEARTPGLLVGYIDRFAPADDAADFDVGQWISICREAYRLKVASAAFQ